MTAARQRKKGLTERQIKILQVLDRFQRKVGYPPTIREIGDQCGISSTSVVNYYLDQLQELGYIERDQGVSRGIRLVKTADSGSPVEAVAEAARQVGATGRTAALTSPPAAARICVCA